MRCWVLPGCTQTQFSCDLDKEKKNFVSFNYFEHLHAGIQLQMTVQPLSALIKCWRCLILFKGIPPLEKGSVVIDNLLQVLTVLLHQSCLVFFFNISEFISFDVHLRCGEVLRLDWAQNVHRESLTPNCRVSCLNLDGTSGCDLGCNLTSH